MRTWRVADVPTRCGCCWRETPSGKPIQVIELRGVDRKRVRCVDCAIGPVDQAQIDADLERQAIAHEAQPVPPYRPRSFARLGDVAGPLFDPKLAAAGRDE